MANLFPGFDSLEKFLLKMNPAPSEDKNKIKQNIFHWFLPVGVGRRYWKISGLTHQHRDFEQVISPFTSFLTCKTRSVPNHFKFKVRWLGLERLDSELARRTLPIWTYSIGQSLNSAHLVVFASIEMRMWESFSKFFWLELFGVWLYFYFYFPLCSLKLFLFLHPPAPKQLPLFESKWIYLVSR